MSETAAETGTFLVLSETVTPLMVLTDEAAYSDFYKRVKAEVSGHEPDLSTAAGRGEIASRAYKVARTKTAIDAAGKKLNEDARKQIDAVDKVRRKIREEFDALAEEVRKPLTEWEYREDERKEQAAQGREFLTQAELIPHGCSSAQISEVIARVEAYEIDGLIFQDETPQIILLKGSVLASLNAALVRTRKYEADQAELMRLRQEQEARAKADEEAAAKAAAERLEREAAEKAERERQELAARQERERIEKEAAARIAEVEAKARAEAEQRAREDRAREDAARAERQRLQDEEDRRKREADIAEAARVEEQRLAAEREEQLRREAQALVEAAQAQERATREAAERQERERQESEAKATAEREARERDKAHRGKVMKAAKESIMEHGGVDEPTAKKIVLAIVAQEVPSVVLVF